MYTKETISEFLSFLNPFDFTKAQTHRSYAQKKKPEMQLPHFRFFHHCYYKFRQTAFINRQTRQPRPLFSARHYLRNLLHFQFYNQILPILYPRHCPICGQILPYGIYICKKCVPKLPYVKEPVCLACGKPVISPEQEYCYDCRIFPKSFRAGLALFIYNEKTRPAMAAFKYMNRRVLSQFFTREICARHKNNILNWKPDLLVPVPIHKNKRRLRGYNQAELLVKDLSVLLRIPCQGNLLLRTEDTAPQKHLRPQARLNNLQNAFTVNPTFRDQLAGLTTVLLIDDIYTTGATMEICTRILHAAGVKHVFIYSVCIGLARD